MGFVLDTIYLKNIVSAPETVNSNWTSESIDIGGAEDTFIVQLNYDNGSSVNMELWLEVSGDGVNFSRVADSNQAIVDASGSHIWDTKTGAPFLRVSIDVTSGSIDLQSVMFKGKRRH